MIEDAEALDLLDPGEAGVDRVHRGLELREHGTVPRHAREVRLHPDALGERGQLVRVEREQCHKVRPAVADDDGLGDPARLAQRRLEIGGRDVLAARGDDEVLLAARDRQEAVLVYLTEIARE